MEERIENYIDSQLENFASALYLISIVVGIVLIFTGVTLLLRRNKSNERKRTIGFLSIGIGFLALFSGILQWSIRF